MPGFGALPAEDRWALAFHIGRFAYPGGEAREGERLWRMRRRSASIPTLGR